MIVLGLDPAKVTGWAVVGGPRDCGTIRSPDGFPGAFASDLSRQLAEVIKTHRPGLCLMEAPLPPGLKAEGAPDMYGNRERRNITNMKNTLTTYGLRMCYLATLHSLKVPTFEVAIQTWRKGYFGKGTKPPAGQGRDWWKKRAMEQAEIFKFPVKNDDEAEAVGIAMWAQGHVNHLAILGKQLAGPVYGGSNAER